MKKYTQAVLILLLVMVLIGGCSNTAESMKNGLARVENRERFTAFSTTGETDSELFRYNIPPWQVGYIENLESLHAQPPYSYEIIVPFGSYSWIFIRDGVIIALRYGNLPDEYGVLSLEYFAVLNSYGEYIIPPGTYKRFIQAGDNFIVVSDSYGWGGNQGVYDFTGNPVIPVGMYDFIGRVYNNTVLVRNDEGLGVINLDGSIIIPFGAYDHISSIGTSDNRLFVTTEESPDGTQRQGLRDMDGNIILVPEQINFGRVRGAEYGLVLFMPSDGFDEAFNTKTGEIISFCTEGLESWHGLRVIKPGYVMTGHGIFNFSGERVSPKNLFFHVQRCRYGRFFSVSQDDKAGIYDLQTGEVFWLGSHMRITDISYPLVSVTMKDLVSPRESAVLDFHAQEVIPFDTYYAIDSILGENRFLVRTTDTRSWDSIAIVNAAGQELVPAGSFGHLYPIGGTDFFWTEYNDRYGEATGVIDFNGRRIFPPNDYLFLHHGIIQTDTGVDHFFLVENSNKNVAFVRLIRD